MLLFSSKIIINNNFNIDNKRNNNDDVIVIQSLYTSKDRNSDGTWWDMITNSSPHSSYKLQLSLGVHQN